MCGRAGSVEDEGFGEYWGGMVGAGWKKPVVAEEGVRVGIVWALGLGFDGRDGWDVFKLINRVK